MSAIIVGAGTYGQVYLHYLTQAGFDIAGFLDDNTASHGKLISGIPVLGGSANLPGMKAQGVTQVFCPIGNNRVRMRVNEQARAMGLTTPNFLHSGAIVDSEIGRNTGIYVLPGAIIMPHSVIGSDVMISVGARVAHHTTLMDGVFMSTNASIGASISVGKGSYFGMGATAVTGKCQKIGGNAVIGAGAVVLSDIADNAVVAGTPAREILTRTLLT